MFFLLLLLHFHWRFYTVSQRIICSVELIHGCPVDSNILSGLFISGHKPMKNILEGVIKKKMHHLFNISTFFHLQKLKIKFVTLSVEFSSGPNRRCRYSIGSDTSIRNGSKKKDTKHETFKERREIQFRKAFTNRPDSERLSREWMRHPDGWNVLRAMLNADNEWEEKVDLICRVKKTQQSKNISHQENLTASDMCLYFLFVWVFVGGFFSFPPSWSGANLQKGGCGLDRVLSSA